MPPPVDLVLNGGLPIHRRRRQFIIPGNGPQNILAMVQRIMSLTRAGPGGSEYEANIILGPSVDMFNEPPFDATGLKDIGNLASWTVSTFKPGCGVEELRNDDNRLFWQ